MVFNRPQTCTMLSFLLLVSFAVAGCDPNSKVVRAPQPSPEASTKPGNAAGDGKDGKSAGNAGDAGDGPAKVGDSEKNGDEEKSATPSALPELPPPAASAESPQDQGSGGLTPPAAPPTTSGGGVPRARGPVSSSSQLTGNCDTGDWGACFRQARSFITRDPKKAIEFYLKACLPGETTGDGLACNAAAMLSQATGNKAGAIEYYKAACNKSEYPVLAACKLASAQK
jgi:hypothetical protein